MSAEAVMTSKKKDLKALFEPKVIAVVGASRRTEAVGYAILKNLLHTGYKGKIYPVNPKAADVLGVKCIPTVAEIPETIEYPANVGYNVEDPGCLAEVSDG